MDNNKYILNKDMRWACYIIENIQKKSHLIKEFTKNEA
jgi:hypothetical protein